MNFMWIEKYFFFIQRLYRDFPSQKDFLTIKCSVRILMTGQIGWSPDGLKDEQRDKRDQNLAEENREFSRHTDECATNKIDHPPPPPACWSRWPHTTTRQCHSCQTRPRAKFCRRENRSIIAAGWLNVARGEVGTEMMMMMMIHIIYIQ